MNKCSKLGIIIWIIILGFSLTSCINTKHQHQFSSTWTCDEKNHWHQATCGHSTEAIDISRHNYIDNKCSVCGYVKHIHEFSSEWTSNENSHWHQATCGHSNEKSDITNHEFVDNICVVCNYKKDIIDIPVITEAEFKKAIDDLVVEGYTLDIEYLYKEPVNLSTKNIVKHINDKLYTQNTKLTKNKDTGEFEFHTEYTYLCIVEDKYYKYTSTDELNWEKTELTVEEYEESSISITYIKDVFRNLKYDSESNTYKEDIEITKNFKCSIEVKFVNAKIVEMNMYLYAQQTYDEEEKLKCPIEIRGVVVNIGTTTIDKIFE